MNKNILISVGVIILVMSSFVIWLLSRNVDSTTNSSTNNISSTRVAKDSQTNAVEAETKQSTITPDSDTSASTSSSNPPSGATVSGSDESTKNATTITYSSGQFSPASVSVAVGGSVQFINSDTSTSVNIASDPHPSHTNFLTLNLGLLAPGKTSSSVKFEKAGIYGYHNHSNVSQIGTIIVK